MKITVLNGSPKGDLSVTQQYIKYIEKHYGDYEFSYINISSRIRKIAEDENFFNEIIEEVLLADLIIWSVPLYVCLVPSQYKRFIELIFDRNAAEKFSGKSAAVVTSSIHFYDNTAHLYMRGICDDLKMNFVGSYSPDMYDLVKEEERERLLKFASLMFESVNKGKGLAPMYGKIDYTMEPYISGESTYSVDSKGKKILILSDRDYGKENLGKMIKRFAGNFNGAAVTRSLSDIDIKGGCLGCCECGFDYKCIYTGKDGYIDFYNEEIKTADIIIFAGEIKDRYLSADWKRMFDRAFFNTHTPTLKGKQMGFLISGPLRQVPNLREILQSYAEWQGANLVDFVTDEDSSPMIDSNIDNLAVSFIECFEKGFISPSTYRGVGGMKVFRDDVWGRLRFVFQADHKYYEETGVYDFPQDDVKIIEMNNKMIELTANPEMRENIRKMIKTEMVKPLKHVVDEK
jgi:multimeric flavodoxin WrbA